MVVTLLIWPLTKRLPPATMISGVPPDEYSISLLRFVPGVPILMLPERTSSRPSSFRSVALVADAPPMLMVPPFAERQPEVGIVKLPALVRFSIMGLVSLNVPFVRVRAVGREVFRESTDDLTSRIAFLDDPLLTSIVLKSVTAPLPLISRLAVPAKVTLHTRPAPVFISKVPLFVRLP